MKYSTPWEHYTTDNFLPPDIFDALKQIEINSDNSLCEGTRTNVTGRYFFTPDRTDSCTTNLVHFMKRNLDALYDMYGYDLSNSVLRMELAQDDCSFWQECHLDALEKRITIIVYISRDDETVNLGTDLFYEKDGESIRVEWKDNRAVVFKPTEHTWHSFSPREFEGKRRVLLINLVDKDKWNSKEQIWDLSQ